MSEFKREIQFIVSQPGVPDVAYDTFPPAYGDYLNRDGATKLKMVTVQTFIEK